MKKLLFILALCLSVFASAQCGSTLNQSARWKFLYSQCFQDTLTMQYVDTSKIAYFDSYGNLTTITYAALLDSLAIEETTYPDSGVLFVGSDGLPTTDSNRFYFARSTINPILTVGTGFSTFSGLTRLTYHAHGGITNGFSAFNAGGAGAGTSSLLNFYKSRGTITAPTSVIAGDLIGRIRFSGYTGSTFTTGFELQGYARQSFSTAANTFVSFQLTNSGGNPVFPLLVHSRGVIVNPTSGIDTDTLAGLTVNGPTLATPDAFSALVVKQTWNTTGSPTAILLNVTNSTSGAAARLLDLQISSTSQWAVNKNGTILGNGNGGVADFTSPLGAFCFRVRGVGRENNNLTFEIQAGRAHSSGTGVEMLSGTNFTGTSGTQRGIDILPTFVPSAAGSMSLNVTSLRYTINGAAGAQTGTVTGLFLDATETSLNGVTHNLMDLRVGGSNRFLVTRTGATTIGSVLTLTPMTSATASALTPAFGMLVVVNDTNGTFTSTGLWFYDSAAWVKLN